MKYRTAIYNDMLLFSHATARYMHFWANLRFGNAHCAVTSAAHYKIYIYTFHCKRCDSRQRVLIDERIPSNETMSAIFQPRIFRIRIVDKSIGQAAHLLFHENILQPFSQHIRPPSVQLWIVRTGSCRNIDHFTPFREYFDRFEPS